MRPAGTTPRNPVLAAAAALPRTGDRVFGARPDQVREARRFLTEILAGAPMPDDAVLCLSELASNAVLHSNSSKAGGTFTVRVAVFDGYCAYIQVHPASVGCAPDHAAGQRGGAAIQDAVPGDSIDLGDPDDLGVPGDRVPDGVLAGRVAERLAPGPDLAAWLSLTPAAELGDADLAAIAGGWRRLASWAQSRELAAIAQIASRAAARDEDIGTGEDGRPLRVPASAAAEVALELTMSRHGAAGWADLAVDLAGGWPRPAQRWSPGTSTCTGPG